MRRCARGREVARTDPPAPAGPSSVNRSKAVDPSATDDDRGPRRGRRPPNCRATDSQFQAPVGDRRDARPVHETKLPIIEALVDFAAREIQGLAGQRGRASGTPLAVRPSREREGPTAHRALQRIVARALDISTVHPPNPHRVRRRCIGSEDWIVAGPWIPPEAVSERVRRRETDSNQKGKQRQAPLRSWSIGHGSIVMSASPGW